MARLSPGFLPFLIGQAMQADDAVKGPRRKGRNKG